MAAAQKYVQCHPRTASQAASASCSSLELRWLLPKHWRRSRGQTGQHHHRRRAHRRTGHCPCCGTPLPRGDLGCSDWLAGGDDTHDSALIRLRRVSQRCSITRSTAPQVVPVTQLLPDTAARSTKLAEREAAKCDDAWSSNITGRIFATEPVASSPTAQNQQQPACV